MGEEPRTEGQPPAEPGSDKAPVPAVAKPAATVQAKPAQGKPEAETPAEKRPSAALGASGAGKPAVPKHVPSPVEVWIEKYLAQAKPDSSPRNFAGTLQVIEYVPQIRLEARRRRRVFAGSLVAALVVTLAGAAGLWFHRPRWPFSTLEWGTTALALGLTLFGLYRVVRPPHVRLIVDALINRIQLWDTRGRLKMINFVGCDYLELDERRGLRGFSYGVAVEPKLGATVRLARSRPAGRTEALQNTLDLVRALVSITHLPVRLRLSRLALGAGFALPEIAPAPDPAPAKEEITAAHTGQ